MNLDQNELISNKLAQIIQLFPVDGRRSDDAPSTTAVKSVQVFVNLMLSRIQRNHGSLEAIKDTVTISFCLQSDPKRSDTSNGWQGEFQRRYPDANTSINSLRNALKLICEMGGAVWISQGRHRAGILHCNVETLLLIEQACMILLKYDTTPDQGALPGDDQLSEAYWEDATKPSSPLRSTLRWLGFIAKRVFNVLPRSIEFFGLINEAAIAEWDKTHRIVVPKIKQWNIEAKLISSWVSDHWLELGDPCLG